MYALEKRRRRRGEGKIDNSASHVYARAYIGIYVRAKVGRQRGSGFLLWPRMGDLLMARATSEIFYDALLYIASRGARARRSFSPFFPPRELFFSLAALSQLPFAAPGYGAYTCLYTYMQYGVAAAQRG